MPNSIEIYTDGSCLNNPNGPSGWAFCIVSPTSVLVQSGGVVNSTNNRMELQAVIEAIEWMGDSSSEESLKVFSDSLLTINCINRVWTPKSNLDLWERFWKAETQLKSSITWEWVKAHNGNYYNELVDKEARNAAKELIHE
jgi:ribonuclease HI